MDAFAVSLQLIAHHLRLIHQQLNQKILNNKRHMPSWKVTEIKIGNDTIKEIEEISSLYSLALKLEILSNQYQELPTSAEYNDGRI